MIGFFVVLIFTILSNSYGKGWSLRLRLSLDAPVLLYECRPKSHCGPESAFLLPRILLLLGMSNKIIQCRRYDYGKDQLET